MKKLWSLGSFGRSSDNSFVILIRSLSHPSAVRTSIGITAWNRSCVTGSITVSQRSQMMTYSNIIDRILYERLPIVSTPHILKLLCLLLGPVTTPLL